MRAATMARNADLALALLAGRLHAACFCIRGDAFRVISLRKASDREVRRYERAQAGKRRPKPLIDEDGEVRELTLADIRRMKPIREVMPKLIEAVEQHRKKLGRPRSESPKVHIGFRLSADLVERIRASGRGYNARVEEALRKADFEKAKDEAELEPKPGRRPRRRRQG